MRHHSLYSFLWCALYYSAEYFSLEDVFTVQSKQVFFFPKALLGWPCRDICSRSFWTFLSAQLHNCQLSPGCPRPSEAERRIKTACLLETFLKDDLCFPSGIQNFENLDYESNLKTYFFLFRGEKKKPKHGFCPWPLLLLIKNAVVLASLWFWASEHSGLPSFLLCKIGIESFPFPYVVLRIKGENNSYSTEKLTSVMVPALGWIWGCGAHDSGGPAALFEFFTVLPCACVTRVCSVTSVVSKSFATPQALLSLEFSSPEYWSWVAVSSSRESSQPRDLTHLSCSSSIGGFFTSGPPGKCITHTCVL